jgi:putative phage-type endonuclease
MGISPWKNLKQLYEEKKGADHTYISSAMQRGIDLEAPAREMFEEMTGIPMQPAVVISPTRNWQMASLDGISLDKKSIVEIKCGGRETHELAKAGKIPEHYRCQIQHQISVVELEEAHYFSFDGKEGALVRIQRDDNLIDALLKKEFEFWEMLQNETPPTFSDRDFEEITSFEWSMLAEEYSSILRLDKRKEEIRKRLIELAEDRNCKGNGIFVQKKRRSGSVDYKEIPELMGIDLNSYRKQGVEYWEISLKSS